MYTYEIDTSFLPKVWVTWATTKNKQFAKRYWLNLQTGEKKDTPESWMKYTTEDKFNGNSYEVGGCGVCHYSGHGQNLWVKDGTALRYAYLKYHPDIEKFEVAVVGIDTTRKQEVHPWKYLGGRYFVDKNKVVTNEYGHVKTSNFHAYKDHDFDTFTNFLSGILRNYVSKDYTSEFKKFYGAESMTIRSGREITFSYGYSVREWYRHKETVPSEKKQKFIASLLGAQLSNPDSFVGRYGPRNIRSGRYSHTVYGFVYFERVNANWSVLRVFSRGYSGEHPAEERHRLYLSDTGKNQMFSLSNDGWYPSRMILYGQYYFANQDEAMAKCNRIKYILTAYTSDNLANIIPVLIKALQYPEAEQLIKLGCENLVTRYQGSITFRAAMKGEFGGYYNQKEKNILKKVGLTKPQLDIVTADHARGRHSMRHLALMRSIFGDDLSHLDIESFRRYYKGFIEICERWYSVDDSVRRLGVDRMQFFKNIVRLGEKQTSAYTVCGDTVRGYLSLGGNRRPEVNWMFDSYSDLVRAHNSIDELVRQQAEERRAYYAMAEAERQKKDEEKRIKLDKERVKYEYDDGEFVIRLPRDLTEIVNEGSKQRICIGGYTGTHARGECTIFFLRRKNADDTPFYAIEMRGNSINQIHGYCNKWLGNNPEAIPTVMRWLRKNNISCDTRILTCTATGYGHTNHHIALPTID